MRRMLCIPTRVKVPPAGANWVHEIKLDGFRVLVRKAEGKVRVLTKSGADFSRRFPLIVAAVASLRAKSVTIDGEAVCFTAGEQDFDKLWNGGSDAILCAFDLLELNGVDFCDQPLLKRKARLQKLIEGNIEFVHHIQGDGQAIFDHACRMGLEGIVSKRIDAPYRQGPSRTWLKTKNAAHPSIERVREAYEKLHKR
jgi:bifunctional non-homologous end joining protein LigD